MRSSLRAAAITLPIVFGPALAAGALGGALDYDPHILTLAWPDGSQERLAATSGAVCGQAVRAILLGLWRPAEVEPVRASCAPGNLFSARSLCIEGYSCPRGVR